MNLNLYHLKTFYLAARFGSLTRAAEVLCITQPAVTRQVKELQSCYGLQLFERIGRRLVLTGSGKVLYEQACRLFEVEEQVEERIRELQNNQRGEVRLCSVETFGAHYLPAMVSRFHQGYPDIYVSVLTETNRRVAADILELHADLGFLSMPVDHPKLVHRPILEDELVVILPPGHALCARPVLGPGDIDGQAMIMHEKGTASRRIIDRFIQKHGLNCRMSCEFSNNESIKTLVREGVGIAIISRNVVALEARRGDLAIRSLAGSPLWRKFHLVRHREKYLSPPLVGFIEAVDAWCAGRGGRPNAPPAGEVSPGT